MESNEKVTLYNEALYEEIWRRMPFFPPERFRGGRRSRPWRTPRPSGSRSVRESFRDFQSPARISSTLSASALEVLAARGAIAHPGLVEQQHFADGSNRFDRNIRGAGARAGRRGAPSRAGSHHARGWPIDPVGTRSDEILLQLPTTTWVTYAVMSPKSSAAKSSALVTFSSGSKCACRRLVEPTASMFVWLFQHAPAVLRLGAALRDAPPGQTDAHPVAGRFSLGRVHPGQWRTAAPSFDASRDGDLYCSPHPRRTCATTPSSRARPAGRWRATGGSGETSTVVPATRRCWHREDSI